MVVAALMFASACGGGGGGPPGSCKAGKNSCATGTEFCCADYAGNFTAEEVEHDCNDVRVMGMYSPDPCPTQDLEASCTLFQGTAAEKTIRYYAGYDVASMSDPATNCRALHGSYTPAPP